MAGLFAALAAWRPIALRLSNMPDDAARQADAVLASLPSELRSTATPGDPSPWIKDPLAMRQHSAAAVRRLIALPADSPSLRLIADQAARVLAGFCQALDGLALLTADPDRRGRRRGARFHVADWLPALVDGGRAFLAIGAAEIFWIVSQWPSGALAITWTAITVILFAPRADESYARALSFTVGNSLAAACAAILLFAVLPNVETFVGFSLVLALYLVPIGALTAQPWQAGLFIPMAANFVPLLAPANPMTYDTLQFYNTALALVVGCGIGALSFRLVPPLSPEFRAARLTAFALARPAPARHDERRAACAGRLGRPHVPSPCGGARRVRSAEARPPHGGVVGRHRDPPPAPRRPSTWPQPGARPGARRLRAGTQHGRERRAGQAR